ncbi:uncharacterized protein LOC124931757 [Impatiens glandulifera]|uniref:uncharacterized protein LOC124931757 n=1 Tax=Impatiens glandulifera TaxID=253017 RepID=UPI001FB0B6B8|nr:uncharacterized protein LOC124931757 [Impatiens glandulifera]
MARKRNPDDGTMMSGTAEIFAEVFVMYNGEWKIAADGVRSFCANSCKTFDIPQNTTFAELVDIIYHSIKVQKSTYDLVIEVMYEVHPNFPPVVIDEDDDLGTYLSRLISGSTSSPLCVTIVEKSPLTYSSQDSVQPLPTQKTIPGVVPEMFQQVLFESENEGGGEEIVPHYDRINCFLRPLRRQRLRQSPLKMKHITNPLVKVPITTTPIENALVNEKVGSNGVYEEDVSVDDGEDYTRSSKVNKLLHGVTCEKFVSRMTFNDMKEVQEVITKYAEEAKVSVDVEIRDPYWIKYFCKGKDCNWMIYACHKFNQNIFEVKDYIPTHTCCSDSTNSNKNLIFVHVSAHGNEKAYNVEGFDGGNMAKGDYEDIIVVDDHDLHGFDESEFDFSDSDLGSTFEGSESGEYYTRTSRVYRLGRGVGSEKFILRMTFGNRKQFREVINRYIYETKLPIRVEISEPNRIKFACKGKGCRWMIYASKDFGSKVFKVKTYIPKHTCPSENNNKEVVTSSFIASYFMSKIISQPRITYRQIQELCLTELNANVSLYKCRRAKSIVKQLIDDNHMYGEEELHPNNPSNSTEPSSNQDRQKRKRRRQSHANGNESSSTSSE